MRRFKYTPQDFESYIGQPNAKRDLDQAIKAAMIENRPMGHILLSGPPGLGKSTLAKIIAHMQGGEFIETVATASAKAEDWKDLFEKIDVEGYREDLNTQELAKRAYIDSGEGISAIVDPRKTLSKPVVFIDEIHRMKPSQEELLYSVMQEFRLFYTRPDAIKRGVKTKDWMVVPWCTIIGATTEVGNMSQPLIERFTRHIRLEPYSDTQLATMIQLACEAWGIKWEKEAVLEIATRSRGVARVAMSYLEIALDYSYELISESTKPPLESALTVRAVNIAFDDKHLCVDSSGLTLDDIRYLYALKKAEGALGLDTLVSITDIDEQTIKYNVEPLMLKLGYITKSSSGRSITPRGLGIVTGHKFLPIIDRNKVHQPSVGSGPFRR